MKDILGVFRVVREEKLDFFVFCFANLFFGAMALWVPPTIASMIDGDNPAIEFADVLRHGHGYFYALAILSASFPYWFRETISERTTDFRRLKLGTGILSGAMVVVCALFVSVLVSNSIHGTAAPAREPDMRAWVLIAEFVFTVAALLLTAYLFCLEHIDKYPQYGIALRDTAVERVNRQMDDASTNRELKLED